MSREKNAWGKATIGLVFLMCVLALGFLAAQGGPPSTKGGGGGGEVEGYGNNLSVPTVFAERTGLAGQPVDLSQPGSLDGTGLRPTSGDTSSTDSFFCVEGSAGCVVTYVGGIKLWPQQTASWWRASVEAPLLANSSYDSSYNVTANWGDNLVNQSWTTNSIIRVEVGLYQTNVPGLSEYEMKYISGTGSSEMWGATSTLLLSPRQYRTVYTSNASLTIEKLLDGADPMSATGTRDPCFIPVTKNVWDNYGGEEVELSSAPTDSKFNAEVNVSGNLIYGFNWTLNRWVMPNCNGTTVSKEGFWRLTFKIEPINGYTGLPSNTFITATDSADDAGAKARPRFDASDNSTTLVIKVNSTRPTGGRRP